MKKFLSVLLFVLTIIFSLPHTIYAAQPLNFHQKSACKQIVCRHIIELVDRFIDAQASNEELAVMCNHLANSVDNWEANSSHEKKKKLAERAQKLQNKLNDLCTRHSNVKLHPLITQILPFLIDVPNKNFNQAMQDLSVMVGLHATPSTKNNFDTKPKGNPSKQDTLTQNEPKKKSVLMNVKSWCKKHKTIIGISIACISLGGALWLLYSR